MPRLANTETHNLAFFIIVFLSSSSLASLAHQFLQRGSILPLESPSSKRAKPTSATDLTIKKSPERSDSASEGGDSSKPDPSDAEALVEACLNTLCPLRCLTKKHQAYEAQREKMGLIGKDGTSMGLIIKQSSKDPYENE